MDQKTMQNEKLALNLQTLNGFGPVVKLASKFLEISPKAKRTYINFLTVNYHNTTIVSKFIAKAIQSRFLFCII